MIKIAGLGFSPDADGIVGVAPQLGILIGNIAGGKSLGGILRGVVSVVARPFDGHAVVAGVNEASVKQHALTVCHIESVGGCVSRIDCFVVFYSNITAFPHKGNPGIHIADDGNVPDRHIICIFQRHRHPVITVLAYIIVQQNPGAAYGNVIRVLNQNPSPQDSAAFQIECLAGPEH